MLLLLLSDGDVGCRVSGWYFGDRAQDERANPEVMNGWNPCLIGGGNMGVTIIQGDVRDHRYPEVVGFRSQLTQGAVKPLMTDGTSSKVGPVTMAPCSTPHSIYSRGSSPSIVCVIVIVIGKVPKRLFLFESILCIFS